MYGDLTDLLIYIRSKLETLAGNSRVYYEKIPETTKYQYPLIIYNLVENPSVECQRIFNLDVEIYDENTTVVPVETLASKIDGNGDFQNATGLNFCRYFDSKIQVYIFRIGRVNPNDPENKIRRRILRYELRVRFVKS